MARPPRPLSVLIFLAAFISMAPAYSGARYGAGYEILNVARTLAETGTFGNPYAALPTGPTAHVAPLYTRCLALLIRFLGYSVAFAFVTSTCALLMHALQAALLPYVSLLLFDRMAPGVCAALMTIFLPLYYFLPEFEIVYDAVGLMLFCLAASHFAARPSRRRALAIGVFVGAL